MIHREGWPTIVLVSLTTTIVFVIGFFHPSILIAILLFALFIIELLVLWFFRNPEREIPVVSEYLVYAPADGKVVVIEETEEGEYFKDKRLMISIFMSPLNVHSNHHPISGEIAYSKYHPGKYLVAWHPKSSTENERFTTVYNSGKGEILIRQIAGALARRIVNYKTKGDAVIQGGEVGFIKFGSRVDIFLPTSAVAKVKLGDKVESRLDVIAEW